MNTSFDTFISPLLSLIDNKLLLFIVVFIITVASLYYIKHKAKSGFSISDRFWIFWTGHKRKEGSDLIDDIIEIEKFNYHYNTNAVSKREKVQFENWVRKYELDFKLLSKLKGYFSIDILKVKKVKTRWSLAAFLLIFVPFFLLWGSLMVALKPAGLIKMKETSWFWLNKNEAAEYNYFGGKNEGWVIKPAQCNQRETLPEALPGVDAICRSFTDQKFLAAIAVLIKQQRWFFGVISGFMLLVTVGLFKATITMMMTWDARKMICRKIKHYRATRVKQQTGQ